MNSSEHMAHVGIFDTDEVAAKRMAESEMGKAEAAEAAAIAAAEAVGGMTVTCLRCSKESEVPSVIGAKCACGGGCFSWVDRDESRAAQANTKNNLGAHRVEIQQ